MGSQFGTGDGVTVAFQIGRQLGTGFDPIYDLNVSPALKVYIGSVLTAAYTINATGLITFSAAPGGGAVLTADFGYYWRVRFADDTLDFEQFVQTLWELKKVSLIQVRA